MNFPAHCYRKRIIARIAAIAKIEYQFRLCDLSDLWQFWKYALNMH
jgi:hypothetical protein